MEGLYQRAYESNPVRLHNNPSVCYFGPLICLFILYVFSGEIKSMCYTETQQDKRQLVFECSAAITLPVSGGATARPPRAAGRARRRSSKEKFLYIKEEYYNLLAK